MPAKVTGTARFGVDTCSPGMLFATVRHSPLLGTRIAAIDNAAEVSGMPGVEGVVRLGDAAVAVVARDTWSALRGAARLSLKPEPADTPSPDGDAIIAGLARGAGRSRPFGVSRGGRCPRPACGGSCRGRGRVRTAVPRPRLHGADELHGAGGGRPA